MNTLLTRLRPLEDTDIERTLLWHNSPDLYATLGDGFRYVSRVAEQEWIRKRIAYSTNEANLAICLRESGEHIGNIYLRAIDWVNRNAALHIFIGLGEHRGKGYGPDATKQLLCHAFLDLNLNRVYLHVLSNNTAAIRSDEKCGFVKEGLLRHHVFKNGVPHDVLVMGILASEFRKAAAASEDQRNKAVLDKGS